MKKHNILIVLLFSFLINYSQNKLDINFDDIKEKIENKESVNFYPKLLKRYNKFDKSLTLEEYSLVYYGHTFSENYIRNRPSEKLLKELIKDKEYEKIIIECKKILVTNPVSIKANDWISYSMYKLNKPKAEWSKYKNRLDSLRKVILESGRGYSAEKAFKVIYISDQYDMIYDFFKISKVLNRKLEGLCDKFTIVSSKIYEPNVIYFDMSQKLIQYQKMMDEK